MERNDLIVSHRINWLLEQSKVPLRGTKDNSHAGFLRRRRLSRNEWDIDF
jgi:hypothetical protein